jgi:hypothetical protein
MLSWPRQGFLRLVGADLEQRFPPDNQMNAILQRQQALRRLGTMMSSLQIWDMHGKFLRRRLYGQAGS